MKYTDEELVVIFEQMAIGFTYKEAVVNVGYDIKRMELTMNDFDVRCHILDLSMFGYHTGWRKGIYYSELNERINESDN